MVRGSCRSPRASAQAREDLEGRELPEALQREHGKPSRALSNSPTDPFTAYLSDNRNLAFRQAMKRQQNRLLILFDKELEVTDPSDRPRIKEVLRELVFRRQFRL